jgi:hypothetical protein
MSIQFPGGPYRACRLLTCAVQLQNRDLMERRPNPLPTSP